MPVGTADAAALGFGGQGFGGAYAKLPKTHGPKGVHHAKRHGGRKRAGHKRTRKAY